MTVVESAIVDRPQVIAYGGENAQSLVTPTWQVAVASVTGPSHARRGGGCEDASASGCLGAWLIAVVCDGAGSASHGAKGAEVASASIVEELLLRVGGLTHFNGVREHVVSALLKTRDKLAELASEHAVKLSAFNATVVGVVGREGAMLSFQIGDGAAVGFTNQDEARLISVGPPKEYANETYFLSDDTWEDSLLFEEATDITTVLLATDGVTPFLLGNDIPKESFYKPILEFVRTREIPLGALAIQRLLDKEQFRKLVADDKTLLWAQCLDIAKEEPREPEQPTELDR